MRGLYLPHGRAPQVAETVRLPAFGETIRRIVDEGADVVYEGEIAEEIVEETRSRGRLLSVEDMVKSEPKFIEPISASYGDREIFQLPPNIKA